MDAKSELLNAGLEGYLNAKQAIGEFERIVSRLSRQVMTQQIEELKVAVGTPDVNVETIKEVIPLMEHPAKNGVGANLWTQDFQLVWGIRWNIEDNGDTRPTAFLAVRLFADYKATNLARALEKLEKKMDGIVMRKMSIWPCEVEFLKVLSNEKTETQLADTLASVIMISLSVLKSLPGGIKSAAFNK